MRLQKEPNASAETHLETTRLKIDRVLLATDFSESAERARKWAVALSNTFGSKLYLLNAISPIAYIGETGMDPAIVQQASLEAADVQMKKVAAHPDMRGLEREEILVMMPPVEAIQRAAETHKIDLVVMGSQGASGLAKLALGSMAEAALRHSPCPVVIIGPKCEPEPRRFDTVLLATDLNVGSLRPAQYAAAMAEENNAKIIVLHVVASTEEQNGSTEGEMRRRMESLLPADAALWSRPGLRVEHGAADQRVLEVAREEKASLIVVGTREAGPLSDHSPWSTVSKVIRGATCPIMAVRAHAEA